jgi:hypothetical protein
MSKRVCALVHCHVCPMKDLCLVGDDEASYKYHRFGNGDFATTMDIVTRNCPMRKFLNI